MLLEVGKENAAKIKEGWEVKRGKTLKTLTTGCILSVAFVLERMGGAHSE